MTPVAGLGVTAALLLLLAIHPESRLYPACPIWQVFGIRCPGCGATRALASLLHGHLHEALRFNALIVCAIPWSIALSGRAYLRPFADNQLAISPWSVYTAIATAGIFAIARNLGSI